MSIHEKKEELKPSWRDSAALIGLFAGLIAIAFAGARSADKDRSHIPRNFGLTAPAAIASDGFELVSLEGRNSAIINVEKKNCTVRVGTDYNMRPNGMVLDVTNYSYPDVGGVSSNSSPGIITVTSARDLHAKLGNDACAKILSQNRE